MKTNTKKILITGITELLGSLPASSALHTEYIASKAKEPQEDEADFVQLEEKGLTVFARKLGGNELILLDYQIKGFIKEAVNNLKADNGVGAGRKKIDNYVFITPRHIPIMREGALIIDEDERFERPLRAQTMQGERVSLASSELIYDPWEIVIEITLLNDKGTKASKPVTWDVITEALNYGFFKGLGQWRNGGYGRFRWEEIK